METGKPEVIGHMNKSAIIGLLKQYGSLSRADLTRMLNMSFPSVSSNTKQLLEDNYIIEKGISAGKDGLGRRSVLLSFNAKRGYIVGVHFNIGKIIAACADLLGNPLEVVEKKMDLSRDGEYAYELIGDAITEVLAVSNVSIDKVESICVGIPGIFDAESKKNKFVPYLKSWEDIQIEERLKQDFIDNIIIENVVNLGVIGEKWKGNAQDYQNIMYIEYDIGISAGLILNGELYRGFKSLAGEVGYMVLSPQQLSKSFSNEGALEELISAVNLLRATEDGEQFERGYFDISCLVSGDSKKIRDIISNVVDSIAVMIINMVAVLNPEIVILSGTNGMWIGQNYMKYIRKIVAAHVPSLPKMLTSKYNDNKAGLYGALRVAALNAASNIDNNY